MKRRLQLVLLAIASTIFLAACGGEDPAAYNGGFYNDDSGPTETDAGGTGDPGDTAINPDPCMGIKGGEPQCLPTTDAGEGNLDSSAPPPADAGCPTPEPGDPLQEGAVCPTAGTPCVVWQDQTTCLWYCGRGSDGRGLPLSLGPGTADAMRYACWPETQS